MGDTEEGHDGLTADYDATGEVRFAVVLYGGVSLAIYMNGITQELFDLVRATAPNAQGDLRVADDDLHGAGPVYRKLGRLIDQGRFAPSETGPVRTRFVVDIISGTSAGGINGVFLAKALANAQEIAPLSDLWITQGDIGKLLNDAGVSDGNPAVKPQSPPLSLLSGDRMLYQLLRAVDHVSCSNITPAPSPYADAIDLWVTTTDLNGRPETVNTARQQTFGVIREANYRTTFHFLYDKRDDINLFSRENDPILAFAARCTSSFPGAFQAVQLSDLDVPVEGVGREKTLGTRDWISPKEPEITGFFRGYGDDLDVIRSVSFADGGYLDNQPVDLVMATLPKRRSELPVARRVLVVDPDPGGEPAAELGVAPERVGLISTILKAATLPRQQTIGGDVDRILALREPLEARRRIYAALESALDDQRTDAAAVSDPPARIAYNELRITRTAGEIGEALARVAFPDRQYESGSEQHRFATRVVEAWLEASLKRPDVMKDIDAATFLDRLDLSYWLRCINFLQGRADRRMRASEVLPDSTEYKALREVRGKLDDLYAEFASTARALRFRQTTNAAVEALRPLFGQCDVSSSVSDLVTALTANEKFRTAVHDVLESFASGLNLADARKKIVSTLVQHADLRKALGRFTDFDEATLALRELIPGENDDIEVIRVSPKDTTSIVDEAALGPKLAGTQVHHFGAFFSEDWRRRDILWGRLDGAERLICALWPASPEAGRAEQRARFVAEAQRLILEDVLTNAGYRKTFGLEPLREHAPVPAAEVDRVLSELEENKPPKGLDPRASLRLAAKAARVADAVGEGLVQKPGALGAPAKWAGRTVRFLAGIVELALPDRVRSVVGRHLLDVTMFAGLLMVVLGGVFGGAGVVGFGWTVLLVVLGLKLVVELLRSWFAHRLRASLLVGLGVLVSVAAVYRVASWHGAARTAGLVVLGAAIGLALGAQSEFFRGTRLRKGAATASAAARRTFTTATDEAKPEALVKLRETSAVQAAVDQSVRVPVVTGVLALIIVIGFGVLGALHARTELSRWSCEREYWADTQVQRVLGECASTTKG